ncbi:NAD(P)/FAD-dependent oxidoreductase [Kyrpidia spormannii]|uniref:Sarcosine oxidase subunit beta n=2 Tax=Kyrpidia spormannii TaxID=2055160 RepID=A0ACA8Z8I8_9BACL|nr:FAD-binding oxidoreductase [Kyrpidia spormannii]CAB3390723.1 Sarcosine oxidase subunit beta [Kyrpidia spormannii]CAB3391636.1 Sarcosine oxidase subunit beta [Kyrpidia spormannii]
MTEGRILVEDTPSALDAEIAVIGAGVVGNSIAFHLAERGRDVLVIDKNYPLSGTSGSTQAWVWVHTKSPASYAEFSLLSAELYPYLKKRIGDVEYQATGGIAPIFDPKDLQRAKRFVETYRTHGIPVELLDRDEVLDKEPHLSPHVVGATFSRVDGNVNPFRLVDGYRRGAVRHGARYSFYNPVLEIEELTGGFVIRTERARVRSKKLVLAAGPWSAQVGRLLGVSIPVDPVRGQIVVTEPLQPLLRYTMSGMRQTQNGEILIGYSKENVGFDRRTRLPVIRQTVNMALQYVPKLAKAQVVRTFSGLRVMPRDELPILGRVPGHEGLYVAATHSGYTLSPLLGTLMAELIVDGETSIPIDAYSLKRFDA